MRVLSRLTFFSSYQAYDNGYLCAVLAILDHTSEDNMISLFEHIVLSFVAVSWSIWGLSLRANFRVRQFLPPRGEVCSSPADISLLRLVTFTFF